MRGHFHRRDRHPDQTRPAQQLQARIRGRSSSHRAGAANRRCRRSASPSIAIMRSPCSTPPAPPDSRAPRSKTCTALLLGRPKCRTTRVAIGTRGAGYPDIGTTHPTMGEQLADHPFCRVDSRGKTNRLRLRDHRGIDADHAALGVDQRAAGVAGIERGVGLNDIVHEPARRCPQACGPSAEMTPVVTVFE